MTDAQIGLLRRRCHHLLSLILYRMGALQGAGTISAVTASVIIAAVLFFGQ
ncbi:hypothetical protein VXQ18_00440 [Brucella abortus]|nr:hypothetical protein [Brucella abortus]